MQETMIKLFADRIGSFGNKEFEISGVKFQIEKLPPMTGFKMAEEIRFNLSNTANGIELKNSDSDLEAAVLFFKAILGLPVEFIENIQQTLFETIQFQGGGSGVEKGWAKLKGMEDMAFQNFEIVNIYEVLVRGLYINFSGSFSGIMSAFPQGASDSKPQG